MSMTHSVMARRSGGLSCFAVPETTFTWRKVAMFGGIENWSMWMHFAQLPQSIASIRFTFSTQADPRGNRKEFYTPPGVIWWAFIQPPNTFSTFATTIFSGARLTWAG